MSKAKGSRYEREFVGLCDSLGLPAERRYGSQQCDDVRVADTWVVECKYRKDGEGFKSLYKYVDGFGLETCKLIGDGFALNVYLEEDWAQLCKLRLEEPATELLITNNATTGLGFRQLRKWIGGADFIAVRMPFHRWLIVEVL